MNPIDPNRYYEVTELHSADAYSRSAIGSIVKPGRDHRSEKLRERIGCPGFRTGPFTIVRGCGAFTLPTEGYFAGARLRPLTQKEQEKIDERPKSPAAG